MLNARRFEMINGHVPEVVRNTASGQYNARCICDCGPGAVLLDSGRCESETSALERILQAVLAEHGRLALERDHWACTGCGSIHGLSAHHKVFRSHGRDDRVENLCGLCTTCHTEVHARRGAAPANIHPVDTAV